MVSLLLGLDIWGYACVYVRACVCECLSVFACGVCMHIRGRVGVYICEYMRLTVSISIYVYR